MVRDIVSNLQKFHSELSDFYFSLAKKTECRKVKNFLEYLAKSERFQENYIYNYRNHTSDDVLKEKVKYTPRASNDVIFDCKIGAGIQTPTTICDVMAIALRYDICLIDFCKTLADDGDNPYSKEVFCNFCNITKREKRNLFTYNTLLAS
ncbi:MAG: hypothetical protein K8R68_11170 [Bacteroidales bacterium]|nr:hypothetical protein [Bacteroidales bacterium]